MYKDCDLKSMEVVEITPEMASSMLKKNTGNRFVRKTQVKNYADMMVRGEWKTTHQGLALNEAGHIIDGQHRLMAIVLANVPVKMVLSKYSGTDSAMFIPLDTQIKRSFSDITGIDQSYVAMCRYFMSAYLPRGVSKNDIALKGVCDSFQTGIEILERMTTENTKVISSAYFKGMFFLYSLMYEDVVEDYNMITLRQYSRFGKKHEKIMKYINDLPKSSMNADRKVAAFKCFCTLKNKGEHKVTERSIDVARREIIDFVKQKCGY